MKLVTFTSLAPPHAPRLGAVVQDGRAVLDLEAAGAAAGLDAPAVGLTSMQAWLEGGEVARETASRLVARAEAAPAAGLLSCSQVKWLAPLPRPASLRDCLAFEQHLIGCMESIVRRRSPLAFRLHTAWRRLTGRPAWRPPPVWYERPLYYKGNPRTVIGQDAVVRWPSYSKQLDYELEFAAVIGRAGRDIPAERALDHVAGYMIFNDFSARDAQLIEMPGRLGPAKGKDFDDGNALGPWLTTSDEVPDPQGLEMIARVNGEEWSRGNSRDMRHTFAQIVAYISRDETLYPGDVIGSGTVGGGCGWELDRWLQPGDVVELEVERLGVLRNRVAHP